MSKIYSYNWDMKSLQYLEVDFLHIIRSLRYRTRSNYREFSSRIPRILNSRSIIRPMRTLVGSACVLVVAKQHKVKFTRCPLSWNWQRNVVTRCFFVIFCHVADAQIMIDRALWFNNDNDTRRLYEIPLVLTQSLRAFSKSKLRFPRVRDRIIIRL